ncbi:lasso peptide biosynthesis PqqD family chaperone [Nocardioides rotundus]|nr:lasso peptide biosynthesis PqqD family chaperone [Nocardioides rotundus]
MAPRAQAKERLTMRFCLQSDISFSETDYGSVILNTRTGRYFQLNAVATRMLQLLNEGLSRDEVVDALIESYDVDRERASSDLTALIQQGLAADILKKREP